jgi:hypothetical protein
MLTSEQRPTTFAEMSEDERRYVSAHREEFPQLDEEVKRFFAESSNRITTPVVYGTGGSRHELRRSRRDT